MRQRLSEFLVLLFSLLIVVSFLSEPYVVLMAQYFGIPLFKSLFKVFYLLFFIVGLVLVTLRWRQVPRFLVYICLAALSYLLLATSVGWRLNPSIYDTYSILVHLFSVVCFVLIILATSTRGGHNLKTLFEKVLYLVPIVDLSIILVIRWNPLGRDFYFNFDSSFLFPTFALSMIYRRWVVMVMHLALFVLHFKRGPLLAAIVTIAIYFTALWLNKNSRTVFIWARKMGVLMGALAMLFVAYKIPQFSTFWSRIENKVEAVNTVLNGKNSRFLHTSHGERAMEVVNGIQQVNNTRVLQLLGAGMGWNYYLSPIERRRYTHATPVFLYIVMGVLGILLWVSIFWLAIRNLVDTDLIRQFFSVFLLLSMLHSLTTLNLLTNPLIPFVIGFLTMFKSMNSSRETVTVSG